MTWIWIEVYRQVAAVVVEFNLSLCGCFAHFPCRLAESLSICYNMNNERTATTDIAVC